MIDRRELLKASGLGGAALLGSFSAPFLSDRSFAAESNLIVHTKTPMNAEPKLDDLVRSWITPTDKFYIRSHAPNPKLDADTFQLSVEGMVDKPFKITLKQLQNEFKKQSVIATMTCAGNRRSEHSLVKKVGGVPWQSGAIGNAQWGGARLSDLLKKAGVKSGAKHVSFEGVDEIERSSGIIPFGASIPLKKAMADSDSMPGALVCYEMNKEPLSPDHGFPMRTVVPGFIGARSVKWLGKIIVSDRPSTNHYVATAYKLVTESTPENWAAAPPIENFAINSVICTPARGASIKAGKVTVTGYALPPGFAGRTIQKLEISTDDGNTWTTAKFKSKPVPFCWRLWSAKVKVDENVKALTVRATDSEGNVQPQTVAWNLKGYLFNAWYRTAIQVKS